MVGWLNGIDPTHVQFGRTNQHLNHFYPPKRGLEVNFEKIEKEMLFRWVAFANKHSSYVDKFWPIGFQPINGCSSSRGQSFHIKEVITPLEMLVPVIFSWMKKRSNFIGKWIKGRNSGMFALVAAHAGESPVLKRVNTI